MIKALVYIIKRYKLSSDLIRKFRPLPILYSTCKFYPTCSEYAEDAICKHGVINGSLKTCGRILRCNPFSKGGYDPA